MYDEKNVSAIAFTTLAAVSIVLLCGIAAHPGAGAATAEAEKTAPKATPLKKGASPATPLNKGAPGATPLKIEALTPAQRTSMPASTLVILSNGRKASLDVLRKEHTARLARFANAPKLGLQIKARMVASGVGYTMVTMKLDPHGAADYVAFCGAVAASGCLYFPGPAGYFGHIQGQDKNLIFDYDPLITDAGVCNSQGGIIETDGSGGCAYGYPYTYMANFNPGPIPPGQGIGALIKSTQNCTPPVSVNVDHNGAIVMEGKFADADFNVVTTSTLTCAVWVSIPNPS